jgi:hypothetical protein|uniref:Uncharacterized protein n=1 Tax=viral metagenome TaxID=1070528 RepID=A0A6C0AI00_9ZZZZ
MDKLFTIPSIMAHTLNGGLLLVGAVLIAMNFNLLRRLPPLQLVVLVLILSIAVGVHAISHVGVESTYGYNPWKFIGL